MRIGSRNFLKKDIQLIQEMTDIYQALSRKELAYTICENLNWKNDAGNLKVDSCLVLLKKLETTGKVNLSPLQKRIHIKKEYKEQFNFTNTININGTVDNFNPYIEIVKEKEENKKWNDFVQRYHYLGYKKNFGLHLKYYIRLEGIRDPIGCFSFVSTTTYHLKCRDLHIGWSKKQREKNLNWIINNNRFLIFPWIKIENLGSKIFSLAKKQVLIDWEQKFNYKPVLFETYVDPSQFYGSIYKSANWLHIGQTSGNYNTNRTDKTAQTRCPKEVYIYPVEKDYKNILRGKKGNALKTKSASGNLDQCIKELKLHKNELDLWEQIQLKIALVCKQVDEQSMQRSQKVNALTMLLALYRIVFAKNFESYSSLLCELLDAANAHGIRLAFRSPIAASTFSEARKRFSSSIFKQIAGAINELYEENIGDKEEYKWFGRRIFAVDGSKVNVPRDLMKKEKGGYKLPCSHAFYPQGLISCLYQLKSRIAYDFSFVNSMNEQDEALKHLQYLKPGDIVVYDRGYLSYALLFMHKKLGIDAIFRLKSASFKTINEFISSEDHDIIKSICPTKKTFSNIKKNYPFIDKLEPYQLRLMKYYINDKKYYIGSTIVDNKSKYKRFFSSLSWALGT
ncbi:MAG: DUF4338 domain-containing protein [Desulfobacteraceae bacterium]|nr:DUF4338 domain-containing protein [Desulfobacteraceae bacterium]MBC2718048.1 DUF4338 domain-containing protein [Desulfobacteraceae bacterium]